MASMYWLIVDGPRFWWFPWIWRIRHSYGKQCEYDYVRKFYEEAIEVANKHQVILLGAGDPDAISILETSR